VDFTNKRRVRIRNRYDADVPVVTGKVKRPGLCTWKTYGSARRPDALSRRPPGPMTMVDTLYDNYYKSRELARESAAILNQEALELERAELT
jgi:5-methyltetrahydropteroyltriglutamate--homocysteine methyltransferase